MPARKCIMRRRAASDEYEKRRKSVELKEINYDFVRNLRI